MDQILALKIAVMFAAVQIPSQACNNRYTELPKNSTKLSDVKLNRKPPAQVCLSIVCITLKLIQSQIASESIDKLNDSK